MTAEASSYDAIGGSGKRFWKRAQTRLRTPAWRVVERNAVLARRQWYIFASGGFEPFLFLMSVGVGVGALVSEVAGPGGTAVPYREFVAPGMLSAAAMNGIIFGTTVNFFIRVKYIHTYDAMLATPITTRDVVRGELGWAVLRVGIYSAAFILTMWAMGLLHSAWAVLLLPAAVLISFAFGSVGLAASTWLRSWLDFDAIFVVTVPMFMLSATFFPLDRYPRAMQIVVQFSPLYHGADLSRRLALGGVGWGQLVSVLYLVVIGIVGLRVAERRVAALLQP